MLAWETPVRGVERDGTPINRLVYTDARTGKRLGVQENIFTEGTGQSLYSGTVPVGSTAAPGGFSMTDTARGGHKTYDATGITDEFDPATGSLVTDTDNLWGDGTPANKQSAAVDAQYGAAVTWDFYKRSWPATASRTTARRRTHVSTSERTTRTPSGTTTASA